MYIMVNKKKMRLNVLFSVFVQSVFVLGIAVPRKNCCGKWFLPDLLTQPLLRRYQNSGTILWSKVSVKRIFFQHDGRGDIKSPEQFADTHFFQQDVCVTKYSFNYQVTEHSQLILYIIHIRLKYQYSSSLAQSVTRSSTSRDSLSDSLYLLSNSLSLQHHNL